ncbi:MAG TPA: gephyrin-like molybdotransferase Glp [Acidimicrobiales bacterium]|nr:gephyrin-like molybdotransferase Glp [Acidimicrobiales bacterium]
MNTTMSLDEILAIVLEDLAPLEMIALAPRDALGLVLAQPIISDESVPRFANSAMDGYAMRSKDTCEDGVFLHIVGATMAGDKGANALTSNQAVRIMTGAPIPEGADAVCMFEETSELDGRVHIPRALAPGTNIRLPGEDILAGMEVFSKATTLGPTHLGVLASIGVTSVRVHRRPVVGVLSCGDELVHADVTPGPGQIRDANRPALLAVVATFGALAVDLGIAGDDEPALIDRIDSVRTGCDLLITSGGASGGDRDSIASALEKVSGARRVHSIRAAIRPAKPLVFAMLGEPGLPVFGLPGNPVSALVAFEIFVKPALRKLAGQREFIDRAMAGVAESDFPRSQDGKVHFVRANAHIDQSGTWHVSPSRGQGAHMLLAMAHSNALVMLRDGEGTKEGERVEFRLL